MKNNKMVMIIICISVVLILGVVGGVFFISRNMEAHKDIDPDIFAIAENLKDNKIYALTHSGKEIELFDLSQYEYYTSLYTYSDGKLYLALSKKDRDDISYFLGTITLGYIDLRDNNYTYKKLYDIKDTNENISSIAASNNSIYLRFEKSSDTYKYDISKKDLSVTNDFDLSDMGTVQLYSLSDSMLVYSAVKYSLENEALSTIGTINTKTGDIKEIASSEYLDFKFKYNGNVIYIEYNASDTHYHEYYEYNVGDDKITQIANNLVTLFGSSNSLIVLVDDYYVYADQNTLYKYQDGETEKLYEFDGIIYHIFPVSDHTLYIKYAEGYNVGLHNCLLDLNTLTLSDTQNQYYNLLYLK